MSILSADVRVDCDVCGDDVVVEISRLDEKLLEKAIEAEGWTINRERHTIKHLCVTCAAEMAKEDAETEE